MKQISVSILKIIEESPETYSLVLESHPELEGYAAGQFLNVYGKINGEEIQRSYSFSSSPLVDSSPVLTIKKVPQGKMSNHLWKTLKVGSVLTVSMPLGRFLLDQEKSEGHVLLIAGGSGITPIFSLLKEGLGQCTETRFTLLYANRNEHIVFQKALDSLAEQHQGRFSIHYFVEAGISSSFTYPQVHQGRITKEFLNQLFLKEGFPIKESLTYVCGPEAMMENILYWLWDFGFPHEQVHTEHFVSAAQVEPAKSVETGATSQVTLRNFNGQEVELSVPRDRDILSEFLENGYALPHYCREAMCGGCAVKLQRGKVDMKENYALNEAKLQEGFVLLCQSSPESKEVVLEYDCHHKIT